MKKIYKIIFIIIFCFVLQLFHSNSTFAKGEPELEVKVFLDGNEVSNKDSYGMTFFNKALEIKAVADDGDGWEVVLGGKYSVGITVTLEGDALKEEKKEILTGSDIPDSDTVGDGTNNQAMYVTYKPYKPGKAKIKIVATTSMSSGDAVTGNVNNTTMLTTTKEITVNVSDPIISILKKKAAEIADEEKSNDDDKIKYTKYILDYQQQNKELFNKIVTEKIPEVRGDVNDLTTLRSCMRELIQRGYYSKASYASAISTYTPVQWNDMKNGTALSPVDSEKLEKVKEAYKKQTGKELEIINTKSYEDQEHYDCGAYGVVEVWKHKSIMLYNLVKNGNVEEDTFYYQKCIMFSISINNFDGPVPQFIIFATAGKEIEYEENEEGEINISEESLEDIENIEDSMSAMDGVTAGFIAAFAVVEGELRDVVTFTDVLTAIDDYIPDEEDTPEEFVSKVNVILTVITSIGMVVSLLILAILGIKYMLGSVEEKAEYKKDMIPYIVGAVLLFGITAVVKIVQQIGESINNI